MGSREGLEAPSLNFKFFESTRFSNFKKMPESCLVCFGESYCRRSVKIMKIIEKYGGTVN